jgi:hypothetical protein
MFKKLIDSFNKEFIGKRKNDWHPIVDTMYYGCMTDEEIAGMKARNEKAIKDCIKKMGKKWVLHKSHQVQKNVS